GLIEEGEVQEGYLVTARVDEAARYAAARNHSATHLVHKALKETLGDHVNQAGSLVAPDRLRFDFTHFSPVSDAELRRIEDRVNEQVLASLPVETFETGLAEAKAMG